MTATAAEVCVVGAGPAGMAAATSAAAAGCQVVVLDGYAAAGGQIHRAPAPGLDQRRAAPTDEAFADLVAAGRIDLRTATTIWTAQVRPDGVVLHLTGGAAVRARTVVLATGAVDRGLPFPGWDLPGVLTAGGAQALLKGQGILPGRRVVVGGTGPFLLPVAAGLADAGCEVVEVVEAADPRRAARHAPAGWQHRGKVAEAAGYARRLVRHRVPIRTRSAITRADGDGGVEQVTISRLGADGAPIAGHDRAVAVDAACVSFGFTPQVGLAALLGCRIGPDDAWGDPAVVTDAAQATSRPGVFAAGEITGVTGASGAAAEGAIAGQAAAAALGRLTATHLVDAAAPHVAVRDRERRFAVLLADLYPIPGGWQGWLTDDTVVCRCEEVPYGTVRTAIDDLAATDLRAVKLTTRCGMGVCQGRMCGSSVADIVARRTGQRPADAGALSTTPIVTPVALGDLAALAAPGPTPDAAADAGDDPSP